MDPWQSILLAFGGNVVLLLVLAWLARSLGSQLLAKDIEKFKADLEAASIATTERLRHELQLAAVEHQNRFVLGASSHMANVAFDKHVEFCEEYVKEAQEALYTIFREGATKDALNHAMNLKGIQQKYAVWITTQIEQDLEPFLMALRQMGASAGYVESTTGDRSAAQRQEHINRMYTILAKLTGTKEWDGKELTDELAVASQIRRLRSILGTEELNEMRRVIVEKAASELRT
jgi:hypothetical protein